jgi:hypothetical protein
VVDMAGLSDCRDVFPVYIGDDRTDEDAFKVRGILLYMVSSILVGRCILSGSCHHVRILIHEGGFFTLCIYQSLRSL